MSNRVKIKEIKKIPTLKDFLENAKPIDMPKPSEKENDPICQYGETVTKTDSECPYCAGSIIKKTKREPIGPFFDGPGPGPQVITDEQYYCNNCKLMYHSLPPKNIKRKKRP